MLFSACIATGANHTFICKNIKRDVRADLQPILGEVGTNSGIVAHSFNIAHTMEMS